MIERVVRQYVAKPVKKPCNRVSTIDGEGRGKEREKDAVRYCKIELAETTAH